jgi:dUTP pyrophosphatase
MAKQSKAKAPEQEMIASTEQIIPKIRYAQVDLNVPEQHFYELKQPREGDAGYDLQVSHIEIVPDAHYNIFHTGIAIEIPKGYVGLLFPRSSVRNTPYSLANAVGVIDSNYRGEIMGSMLINKDTVEYHNVYMPELGVFKDKEGCRRYKKGDKFLQLVIVPYLDKELEKVELSDLSVTERGTGGHGSTGR